MKLKLLIFLLIAQFIAMKANEQNTHTVICVLEARQGKETELKNKLAKIAELSKKESGCLEYRLAQDKNNLAQFVLYENWTNKQTHELQFKRDYIIEFAKELAELLAKPYLALEAQEIK